MKRISKIKQWFGLGLAGLLTALSMPTMAMASGAGSCSALPPMPVALGPGLPADQTVAGTLCLPNDFTGQRQIDILVHGASYNRVYWDFPQESYVQRTLAAGRATFAYDRLGTGQSSRPLSTSVTIEADAFILHQIISAVGHVHQIKKVNVIGHSFGSIVATSEAATYHDVDRLVLTGLLHSTGPGQTDLSAFYPAAFDPKFAGQNYDLGYLTSVPGRRGELFYYAPTADPAVIAYDEQTKDVASSTQFGEGLGLLNTPAGVNLSNQITVPVFITTGEFDTLFCGLTLDCANSAAVQANEAPYYTGSPSVTTSIVANTGHDIALHTTAATSFANINNWIQTH